MALTITKRPEVDIEANTSYWNACGDRNPVIYEFSREDLAVATTNVAAGLRVQVNTGVDLTGVLFKGDVVYLSSDVYEADYIVFSVDATSVTLDTTYIADTVGGYINYLKNYRISTQIFNSETDQVLTTAAIQTRTTGAGFAQISYTAVLRAFVTSIDEFGYDVINEADLNASFGFYIKVTELFTGSNTTVTIDDSASVYYIANAAKQLQELYGVNMGEYVPFVDGDPQAKWLTKFDRPVMWRDWPFDMSFIYPKELEFYEVYRKSVQYDVDGNQLADDEDILDSTQTGYVNRLTMVDPLETDTTEIVLSLITDGVLVGQYDPDDYDNADYT